MRIYPKATKEQILFVISDLKRFLHENLASSQQMAKHLGMTFAEYEESFLSPLLKDLKELDEKT